MASRKPSYAAPSRLALLMLTLAASPAGVPMTDIDRILDVSERTRHRYVALLRRLFGESLHIEDGWIELLPSWQRAFAYRGARRTGVA